MGVGKGVTGVRVGEQGVGLQETAQGSLHLVQTGSTTHWLGKLGKYFTSPVFHS